MKRMIGKSKLICAGILAAALVCCPQPLGVKGEEDYDVGSVEKINVSTEQVDNELIAVVMPIVEEEYLLDFFIDPQELLYRICHIPDGVHGVEEGAHLLFHNWNREGYIYSSDSDVLTVSNCSTVPVRVTITAKIDSLGKISLAPDADFTDEKDCSIYLAVKDNEGNEVPLTDEGEICLTVELQKAPEDAYVYRVDEESGEYRYAYLYEDSGITFDEYSFWLTGESNPNALWDNVSAHPNITVTWHVDPILPDEDEAVEETEEAGTDPSDAGDDQKTEETADGNDQSESVLGDMEMSKEIMEYGF